MYTEDLAYAAGFIDGDGSLGIEYSSSLNRYYIQVRAWSINSDVPNWLKDKFGGYVIRSKQNKSNLRSSSDMYLWRLCGKKSQDFIKLISPYMIEKSTQANCIIAFPFVKKHGDIHSEEDIQLMGELRDKLRFFNSNKGKRRLT